MQGSLHPSYVSENAMYFRQQWIIILAIATAVGGAEPPPFTAFSVC